MDKMEALIQFVRKHATRGACQCGRCAVSEGTGEKPTGHTINLTFFEVGMIGDPDVETFKKLAEEAGVMPPVGGEVGYIQLGGDIGDQGTALLTMGLGHLLGAWTALSPDTVTPFLPPDLKQRMAGQGLVSIRREKAGTPVPTPATPPPPTPDEERANDFKLAEEALANPKRIPYSEVEKKLGWDKSEGRRRGKKEPSGE